MPSQIYQKVSNSRSVEFLDGVIDENNILGNMKAKAETEYHSFIERLKKHANRVKTEISNVLENDDLDSEKLALKCRYLRGKLSVYEDIISSFIDSIKIKELAINRRKYLLESPKTSSPTR